jgi:hypothetical protein
VPLGSGQVDLALNVSMRGRDVLSHEPVSYLGRMSRKDANCILNLWASRRTLAWSASGYTRAPLHPRRATGNAGKFIQVANPTSFLAQKILIRHERDYKDRAKDLLYMHDTIEVFSRHLGELYEIYTRDVAPRLHAHRRADLSKAADLLFGRVNDTIREAALMAAGRTLSAERLAESGRAGLKEIFSSDATI